MDMDERDLRLFALSGDRRKPFLFQSIANLPCGSYKLLVDCFPHALIARGQVSWQGYGSCLETTRQPSGTGSATRNRILAKGTPFKARAIR